MAVSMKARNLRIPFVWIILLQYGCLCSTVLEDNCIWEGSGVADQEHPSIIHAESTCNQGELHWAKPYGGLRVTFRPRDVPTGFKLCLTSKHPGINIYREGLKNLTLLRDSKENDTRKPICITTTNEHVVLYLESQENRTMAKLTYSVLVRGRKKPRHRRPRECKPCRYSKLLESFCNSDFVVRGYIDSTFPLTGSGETAQANVIATDVIRQKNSIFVKRPENDEQFFTSMKVPSGCHWKQSKRQLFLLTGNVEDGRGPVLRCHLKEEIWPSLTKESISLLCRVFH